MVLFVKMLVIIAIIMGINMKLKPVVVCFSRRGYMRIWRTKGILLGNVSIVRNCWLVFAGIWLLVNWVVRIIVRDITRWMFVMMDIALYCFSWVVV